MAYIFSSIWDRDGLNHLNAMSRVLGLLSGGMLAEGVNLLNKNSAINGKYVNYLTGEIKESSGFSLIQGINVVGDSYYYFTPMNQFAWRDANGNYISGGSHASSPVASNPIKSPANAATVDLTVSTSNLDVAMFSRTSAQLPYEPYREPARALTTYDLDTMMDEYEGDLDYIRTEQGDLKINQDRLSSAFVSTGNLINKDAALIGQYVIYLNGNLGTNPDFSAILDIPIKPNTDYFFTPLNQFAWKDSNGNYISGGSHASTPVTTNPITSPANARTISVTVSNSNLDSVMLSESSVQLPYEPFGITLDPNLMKGKNGRLYDISQIFNEWESGSKFPIAFVDDSQTDGSGTTGNIPNELGTDNKSPNAYPKLLEDRMKTLSGKSALRVYNAGFSGRTARWMNANFDAEFGAGTPYADTKIAFIGFGTNDRLSKQTPKEYYDVFKSDMETLINKFLDKGIQPVMMTEQPAISPSSSTEFSVAHPLRNSGYIKSISDAVKQDLAEEYSLELIDLKELLRKVMNGVSTPLVDIFNGTDGLHFGDEGHKLVRDVFTAVIYPYTLTVEDNEVIDFTSQYIHKGIPEEKVNLSGNYGYTKGYCDFAVTSTELLLKQSIYIDDYKNYALRCYKYGTTSSVVLKVDGVSITTPGSTLDDKVDVATLEPGYHDIEVWSGTTRAGFRGLSLVEKPFEM